MGCDLSKCPIAYGGGEGEGALKDEISNLKEGLREAERYGQKR